MKNEIIHLSGCDCSGKSTICGILSKKLGYPIKHFDKPNSMLEAKNDYFNFLKFLDKSYICDRFHDGEKIYAPLYRGYTIDYLQDFEKKLRKIPYLFVNTYASVDTLLRRADVRGEDFLKREDFKKVVKLFETYVFDQSMPYLRINTENNDPEGNSNKILEKMEIIREFNSKNKKKDIYFGNIEGDIFVIINDEKLIDEIKYEMYEDGLYYRCWFTTNESDDFIEFQKSKLNIKKIIKF